VSVIFKKILSSTFVYSSSCRSVTFSSEKVEKVVSAPKKPVITSALYSGCILWAKYIAASPMIKLPKTLTLSVPTGKKPPKSFWV